MNRSWIVLAAVTLAACTGEPRHYGPPPPEPMQSYPQRPYAQRPAPARPGPYAPPQVASAGPLKVAAVSAYMDGQENELRSRLRGQGVIVARRGDDIVLNIPNAALFDSGADLSGTGASILQTLAISMRHYDHTALQVSGYTDTTGAPDKNVEISQRRAKAVAAALANYGVSGNRIAAQGFGETNPRIKTGENVNEPRNRRTEIHITATPVG
jgi:outer membrane protein OmpA-like peptidoglycan-associated protein